MNTLFEYKTKHQEEVAKIKSMLFQAIASYTLRKSEKTYHIILSSIRLNQKKPFCWRLVSVLLDMWKTIFQLRKKCIQEYFKHKGNHYATLPWFGTKIAQKHAKRIKTKTGSTQVFVVMWNATFSCSQFQGNVRSQRVVHPQWRLERNVTFPVAVIRPATSVA